MGVSGGPGGIPGSRRLLNQIARETVAIKRGKVVRGDTNNDRFANGDAATWSILFVLQA